MIKYQWDNQVIFIREEFPIFFGGDVIRNVQDDYMDQFYKAILSLETLEDCYSFFEDVATVTEIKALAQRFQVAKMLKEGYTYQDIEEKTGASTATISRVKRFLHYGAGGYEVALKKLNQKEQ
ncbi:YerC/YecD family TrpR-related protein [Natranaerobius thermophilus JW/NM-WN-LF]|uniref:TrpR like protein, YerC/YecD n=2 Tax=Natranaerobius TaxID=375928 RepID=B2A5W3_NATTJ|nr:YerC/YecD family TrpR-related protein [Natranaerobius thermophilus]ACB84056.1 TrpR like protein, YerC/YecD [Natranaerobius thermophilus JW/NM-WN-LF]